MSAPHTGQKDANRGWMAAALKLWKTVCGGALHGFKLQEKYSLIC